MLGRAPRATLDAPFGYVALFDHASDLESLTPDLEQIATLERGALIVTAPSEEADFALRVFAPKLGLPEDPVCGTAHRILVPLWAERLGRSTLSSHQLSKRGGRLYCQLDGPTVTISGDALLFLEGSLSLSA
jgi:predicted PhzF superfamily epimerase YddE/YHI9